LSSESNTISHALPLRSALEFTAQSAVSNQNESEVKMDVLTHSGGIDHYVVTFVAVHHGHGNHSSWGGRRKNARLAHKTLLRQDNVGYTDRKSRTRVASLEEFLGYVGDNGCLGTLSAQGACQPSSQDGAQWMPVGTGLEGIPRVAYDFKSDGITLLLQPIVRKRTYAAWRYHYYCGWFSCLPKRSFHNCPAVS
jgi:hypothetical protein